MTKIGRSNMGIGSLGVLSAQPKDLQKSLSTAQTELHRLQDELTDLERDERFLQSHAEGGKYLRARLRHHTLRSRKLFLVERIRGCDEEIVKVEGLIARAVEAERRTQLAQGLHESLSRHLTEAIDRNRAQVGDAPRAARASERERMELYARAERLREAAKTADAQECSRLRLCGDNDPTRCADAPTPPIGRPSLAGAPRLRPPPASAIAQATMLHVWYAGLRARWMNVQSETELVGVLSSQGMIHPRFDYLCERDHRFISSTLMEARWYNRNDDWTIARLSLLWTPPLNCETDRENNIIALAPQDAAAPFRLAAFAQSSDDGAQRGRGYIIHMPYEDIMFLEPHAFAGGSGSVFIGLTSNGSYCAIKAVDRGSVDGEDDEDGPYFAVAREAAIASLQGAPCLRPRYVFATSEQLFLVLPLIVGNVSDILSELRAGAATSLANMDVFVRIAASLKGLHAKGIVHSDVKIPNVFFDGQDLHLADFGFSSSPDAESGTSPNYFVAAPETVLGFRTIADESADVFSLGLLFLSLLEAPPLETIYELIQAAPDVAPNHVRAAIYDACDAALGLVTEDVHELRREEALDYVDEAEGAVETRDEAAAEAGYDRTYASARGVFAHVFAHLDGLSAAYPGLRELIAACLARAPKDRPSSEFVHERVVQIFTKTPEDARALSATWRGLVPEAPVVGLYKRALLREARALRATTRRRM